MNKIELLAPAGDFESFVAAVQSGADSIYFGASKFNARMNTTNFEKLQIQEAITYAKLRNVKTYLTLNTLMKNDEMEEAIQLVGFCYQSGIDAIIVQDLGLACKIIEVFSELPVHASTQMTIHNIDGVKKLETLGLKRVVLSRELSLEEINKITKNTKVEIEVFVHGALCISYSGQCLMSSMIGGRSGNRGKCAGTCRLPYELIDIKQNRGIEKGYLLSSKDVSTLDILPQMISSGIQSLKIEGRMKSPEYVGIVTSIYRKYIDLAYSDVAYKVEDQDREKLLQIFNRGGFSTGYLKGKLASQMMYPKKPNHIGVLIGEVESYSSNRGYVTYKTQKEIQKGDVIAINEYSGVVSELMDNNQNIKIGEQGQTITIGRIKGDIKKKDKIYRLVSYQLNKQVNEAIKKENRKRDICAKISITQGNPLKLFIQDSLTGIKIEIIGEEKAGKAEKEGLNKERIKMQLGKTGNTIFHMKQIDIQIQPGSIIPISSINDIRRKGLEQLEEKLKETIKRKSDNLLLKKEQIEKIEKAQKKEFSISLHLNNINELFDYSKLEEIQNIYIPIEECMLEEKKEKVRQLANKFNTYIYFPAIIKDNRKDQIYKTLDDIDFRIKGFVVSNISQLQLLEGLKSKKEYELISNYTMQIMNDESIGKIKKMGFGKVILSPEIDKDTINHLSNEIQKELIVYGRTLLMTSEYCFIGEYYNCDRPCKHSSYILKDRLGYQFPIVANSNCTNQIYNSKITWISYQDIQIDSICIDILEETMEQINEVIKMCKLGKRKEGQEYTNGNINKSI